MEDVEKGKRQGGGDCDWEREADEAEGRGGLGERRIGEKDKFVEEAERTAEES